MVFSIVFQDSKPTLPVRLKVLSVLTPILLWLENFPRVQRLAIRNSSNRRASSLFVILLGRRRGRWWTDSLAGALTMEISFSGTTADLAADSSPLGGSWTAPPSELTLADISSCSGWKGSLADLSIGTRTCSICSPAEPWLAEAPVS